MSQAFPAPTFGHAAEAFVVGHAAPGAWSAGTAGRVTPGRAPCAVSVSRCHSAGTSGVSGAAGSRNALSVVQAVVLAGQLMVVRDSLPAW